MFRWSAAIGECLKFPFIGIVKRRVRNLITMVNHRVYAEREVAVAYAGAGCTVTGETVILSGLLPEITSKRLPNISAGAGRTAAALVQVQPESLCNRNNPSIMVGLMNRKPKN
jgi:hypothetical protein